MKAKIKYIKLLEDNNKYGFLVGLDVCGKVKTFGGITDKVSFRKFFFGLLSIVNNYDITDLACVKGARVSCLFEYPDTLNQRISAIGYKSKFMVNDKNEGYVTRILGFRYRQILRNIKAIQDGTISSIKSMSGTICTIIDFDSFSQSTVGPNLFVGLGYPLSTRSLDKSTQEFVTSYSNSYIVELIKTVIRSKYLYNAKKNSNEYYVECLEDEFGNIISLGGIATIEGHEKEIFINKENEEYKLSDKPQELNDTKKRLIIKE